MKHLDEVYLALPGLALAHDGEGTSEGTDDVAEVPKAVKDMIDGVKGAIMKDVNKLLAKQTEAITPLTQQLTDMQKLIEGLKPAGGDPDQNKGKGGGKDDLPTEVRGQLKEQKDAIDRLNKELADQKAATAKANEAKERADRDTAVGDVLETYKFRDTASKAAARRMLLLDVDRDDDGNLFGGSEKLPLDQFIKGQMGGALAGLLESKVTGGSGAGSGTNRNGGGFDLDEIKPGMDPKRRAEITAHVASLRGSNGN